MKQILFALLAIFTVAASACTSAPQQTTDENVGDDNAGGKMCIQVITPAKNDATGECREFPTPCDVPTGWSKVDSCESDVAGPRVVEQDLSTIKTFEMTADKFDFEPNVIRVRKGDHVVLKVTSVDVAHGLMIPEFNINVQVPAGETRTVEFDATKVGSYPFRCSVACGSGHSRMTGTLIVE